jgi:hypothetical protein
MMEIFFSWLGERLSDASIMATVNLIKSKYFIAAGILFPFVWPPIKWLLKKYVAMTPWTSDDKIPDQLDDQINDVFDKRMGLKKGE